MPHYQGTVREMEAHWQGDSINTIDPGSQFIQRKSVSVSNLGLGDSLTSSLQNILEQQNLFTYTLDNLTVY